MLINKTEIAEPLDKIAYEWYIKLQENKMRTVQELADACKLSKITISRLCRSGKIRAIRIGGSWRIPDDEFERVLKEGTDETQAGRSRKQEM